MDPNAESGYVQSQWNSATGQLVSVSNVAILASNICLPLQDFAIATMKPTQCRLRPGGQSARIPLAAAPDASAGSAARASRPSPATAATTFGPCFGADSGGAARMPASFWTNYRLYATAILTLAHESIHLSGIVGGVLPNGRPVGDPDAEAKADCYGMQWMPYIAQQLGDSPDDAQAIADFYWTKLYPSERTTFPNYWSADCRPGGALDNRPPGSTAWP